MYLFCAFAQLTLTGYRDNLSIGQEVFWLRLVRFLSSGQQNRLCCIRVILTALFVQLVMR